MWYYKNMKNKVFTAIIKKDKKYFIGWIEEIPGVNTQGKNKKEILNNLSEALSLILETNKMFTLSEMASTPAKYFFREKLEIA